MFQQILNVKKFEHQIIFNSLQLENLDEQAAAIRREVATREEILRDLSKVFFFIYFFNLNLINLVKKNNAKICC